MNPSDYRRDYAVYHSAVERERLKSHAGARPELRPVEERYAGLWTREAIEDLRRACEETPAEFETERAGLRSLAGAARLKYAEAHAREVTEELGRCTESSGADWDGAKLNPDEASELMSAEGDAARRRELTRRWLDSLRACDDLRAARLEELDAAARELGFGGRRALYESFTGVDVEALAAEAGAFLERTESAFMSRLARWAARELPQSAGGAEYADQFSFARAARFDAHFPARDFRALYKGALAALGVRVQSQNNLHIEDARPSAKHAQPACFPVRPPEDVRLVVGAHEAGLDFYRRGFHEGGRAQMFAWASRETAARYPEFVYAPDAATEEGHARLLSGFLREPSWLAEARGMRASEAAEVGGVAALLELYEARRDCARLRHALAIDSSKGARSEQTAEEYVSLFVGATGFRHHAATALLEADEWFHSATSLRARLFGVGFAEHLRTRHGRRWFSSRAAGDELIDVWNTASRYSAEELARLVWGGALSFDLLADALAASLEGNV